MWEEAFLKLSEERLRSLKSLRGDQQQKFKVQMDSLLSFGSSTSSVSYSSSADLSVCQCLSYTPSLHKLRCYFSSVFGGLLQMSQTDDIAHKRAPRSGIQVLMFWKTPWVLSNMMFEAIITSGADVMMMEQFCAMMQAFGLADLKHIATLIFRMIDFKHEGKITKEDMKGFLRRACACLQPTWLQSYKEASIAIEGTVKWYFGQTVSIDLKSFQERCYTASNDPFLELTKYLANKLDVEGRLFRYECILEFKNLLKPTEVSGVKGFYYSVQGLLTSKLAKFKEHAQYMNSASSSSQNTTCTLFSGSIPSSQITTQGTTPVSVFCKGILLQRVIRQGQPCLMECYFELRGQQLYMTHVEGREVEGAVMFLIAKRALLINRGAEEVGLIDVYRFDIIYGSQSKTFFTSSLEEHCKWIKAFQYILKRPVWACEETKIEDDEFEEDHGMRIE